MTRRQLALLILINGALLIASMLIPSQTSLILLTVMGANIAFIFSLSNQIKAEAQRSVLQFKSLSEQQEKNFNIKSAQLETIVSNLPFPMALIDSQGNIILSNPLFHGFATPEAKPNETDTKYFISEIRSFIRNTYISEEAALKSININTIDYQAISVPVYDPKSRYTGSLVMFLDITQILEGERIQKRFIADASHELKTPLSSITGMIQILNRPDFKDEETRKEFTQQIEQEALRMDNIIQDLLTLSKLSSKAVILKLERVPLIELIQSAYAPLKQNFEEKKLEFGLTIDESIVLNVDREKFHQILTNLLVNGLKYTEKGSVRLEAHKQDGLCILSIQDTGIGIKKEDQKYIFERFYRSDHSRSRHSGGSGLGLAIVKSYLTAHKADIDVSSDPDQGTVFTLRIPLAN